MTELLNRLLDFSKLVDGRLTVVLAPFDPRELVHDLEAFYRQLCESSGLEFEATIDPALGDRLVGDITKLRQIADNLLSNAVKYTAAGSVKLLLRPASDDAHWLLAVEDSGRGIAAESRPSLFREFYRVPALRISPEPGSGLRSRADSSSCSAAVSASNPSPDRGAASKRNFRGSASRQQHRRADSRPHAYMLTPSTSPLRR
jgi:two-component system capsular synthesis sensor histidine kinase RcsC